MAKPREKQLWDKVSSNADWSRDDKRLLQAICIIVAEATKKPAKARKKSAEAGLPFGPQEVHKRLLASCSDHVNVATYDKASFGRLGKTLGRVSALCLADLDHLEGWINDGGVEFWQEKPTWTHVIKHIVDWIAQAREWGYENAGRADLESSIR